MRLAFLCTSGLDDPSPRGRWLPAARQMARAGYLPHLLMLHPTWDQLSARVLTIDRVGARYVAQMHVYGYPGARRYYSPLRLLAVASRAALTLAAEAIRLHPAIVIVAKPQPINGLAGILAARALNCPLMVDCDDYEAAANRFGGEWQRRLVAWWEDALPLHAQGITVNTRFLERRCRTLGVATDRLRHIPNGVSAEQFERPPAARLRGLRTALDLVDRPTLIYLGAVSTVAHGLGLLLDSFALVLRRLPEAHLLIVGDGDDRPALAAQSSRLGIARSVRWVGSVPAQAARSYLALADASVDPVTDTPAMAARSPLKVVESLAQGIPVITGDVGDRRETLGGTAGLIVAPGDTAALAEGIAALLGEPALRAMLAEGARERAEAYRWERLALPWLELLGRLAPS